MIQTVDKSGDRVRKMFSQIAPRYDLMNHVLSMNIDRWWRKFTVDQLKLDGSEIVLDVCTGTGDLAIALAKKVEGRCRVIGTDFCGEMLDVARKKQTSLNIPADKLEFIEADTQTLPLDDDSCQVVSVAFGLRNVSDTVCGLKEMMRVCKPGGQIAVLEFSQPSLIGLKQAYQFYFKHVLPRVGQAVARNNESAYEYLPASVSQFPCGKELTAIMESVGLINANFTPLTFGIATLYLATKPLGTYATGKNTLAEASVLK